MLRLTPFHSINFLDFDPLPPGLPLHGWLLQPWDRLAERLNEGHEDNDGDLVEDWHQLFESAVIGWTNATLTSKGFVERTLDFQLQTRGWSRLRSRWRKFVDTVVKRYRSTYRTKERIVFVVPIDDVDLQVRRVPELLHATRLLSHPNVVYLMTGDREHMRDLIHADYLRVHGELLGDGRRVIAICDEKDHVDLPLRRRLAFRSEQLSDALIKKALPETAVWHLHRLRLQDVLENEEVASIVGANSDGVLRRDLDKFAELYGQDHRLLTHRELQHALDAAQSTLERTEARDVLLHAMLSDGQSLRGTLRSQGVCQES